MMKVRPRSPWPPPPGCVGGMIALVFQLMQQPLAPLHEEPTLVLVTVVSVPWLHEPLSTPVEASNVGPVDGIVQVSPGGTALAKLVKNDVSSVRGMEAAESQ